jgi:hypothetical protein
MKAPVEPNFRIEASLLAVVVDAMLITAELRIPRRFVPMPLAKNSPHHRQVNNAGRARTT